LRILKQFTAAQKWVIVLIGLTLVLALGNLGRALVALQYASSPLDLSTTAPLSYFAAMGIFWGLAFFICTVGLSRFRDWGRWSTLAAITLYQAHIWINHLLFNVSDYARRAAPRNLVLTALSLLAFWGLLSLPMVRGAFDGGEGQD
jgi:hypothetical protein